MKLFAIVILVAFISVLQVNSTGHDTVDEKKIICTLYNEKHPLGISTFTNEDLMPDEAIIVLIHSWLEDSNEPWISKSMDNIFDKYETVNVITADYSAYSQNPNYRDVYDKVPAIAKVLAKKSDEIEIKTDEVSLIGYGLGAQMAGALGRLVNAASKPMLKAIIALDAAGVHYDESKPTSVMVEQPYLQSGDAEHVIGLYSGRDCNGMKRLYADINIFINDGSNIDCKSDGDDSIVDDDISTQSCSSCSSIYARETFVKAISKDPEYVARKCDSYENYVSCSQNAKFVIEIFFDIHAEKGLYFISIDEDFNQIP